MISLDKFKNLNIQKDLNGLVGKVYATPTGKNPTNTAFIGLMFDILTEQDMKFGNDVSTHVLSQGQRVGSSVVRNQAVFSFTGYVSEYVIERNKIAELEAVISQKASIVGKYTNIGQSFLKKARKFISKATGLIARVDRAIKDAQTLLDPLGTGKLLKRLQAVQASLTAKQNNTFTYDLKIFGVDIAKGFENNLNAMAIEESKKQWSWQTGITNETLNTRDRSYINSKWVIKELKIYENIVKTNGMLKVDISFIELPEIYSSITTPKKKNTGIKKIKDIVSNISPQ